jgi:hypothetical protein
MPKYRWAGNCGRRPNTYEIVGLIARLADANCGKIAPGSLLLLSSVLRAHHFRFERR